MPQFDVVASKGLTDRTRRNADADIIQAHHALDHPCLRSSRRARATARAHAWVPATTTSAGLEHHYHRRAP